MPTTHTQSPAVTGTSVLGVKFKDGVVVAADNLGIATNQMPYERRSTNDYNQLHMDLWPGLRMSSVYGRSLPTR